MTTGGAAPGVPVPREAGVGVEPTTPRSRRRPLRRYTAPPSHQTVSIVLVMVGSLYLTIPMACVALLFYRPVPLSYVQFGVAYVLAFTAIAMNVRDVRDYRSGRWENYSTTYTLAELFCGFAGSVMLCLAVGDPNGLYRPILFFPLLLAVVIFDGPLLVLCWIWSLIALATVTWFETLSVEQTFWLVFVYGITWGVGAMAVHYLVRRLFYDLEGSDGLAAVASSASTLSSWDDLSALLPTVADALAVDRLALGLQPHRATEHAVVMWPEGWLDEHELTRLADRAEPEPMVDATAGLTVVRGTATQADVVLIAPQGRVILRTPINTRWAVTAVNLLAGVADRVVLIGHLQDLAVTDELTGLGNRRQLFDRFTDEIERARRDRQPLSVAMLDLDRFKAFNDTRGHQAGDALLRRFAGTVGRRIRGVDTLARYGGEEFCLLLPATAVADAVALVDEIRRRGIDDGAGGRVTFSAGVAEWDGWETVESIIGRADVALYGAKERGRNQVVAAPRRSEPAEAVSGDVPV